MFLGPLQTLLAILLEDQELLYGPLAVESHSTKSTLHRVVGHLQARNEARKNFFLPFGTKKNNLEAMVLHKLLVDVSDVLPRVGLAYSHDDSVDRSSRSSWPFSRFGPLRLLRLGGDRGDVRLVLFGEVG